MSYPKGTKNEKHGMSRTPEYNIWKYMKDRCCQPNNNAYSRYGARGILVCEEWLHSFATFYKDMGSRPSKAHSIDRINGALGYCKSNCRWATQREQTNNTRSNLRVKYCGEIDTIPNWCRRLGLNYNRVRQRITLLGWDVKRAFSNPKSCRK